MNVVNLQSEFIEFNDEIKLDEEIQTPREKREILSERKILIMQPTHFNQSIYAKII